PIVVDWVAMRADRSPLLVLLPMFALLVASHLHARTTMTTQPATQPIDPAEAKVAFDLAKSLSDRDAGKLWGRPLYGPMLLVDPATRFALANQADAEGKLSAIDGHPGLFAATLPDDIGIANTATRWA